MTTSAEIAFDGVSVSPLLLDNWLNFRAHISNHDLICRHILYTYMRCTLRSAYAYILVCNLPNYLCMARRWGRSATVRVWPNGKKS